MLQNTLSIGSSILSAFYSAPCYAPWDEGGGPGLFNRQFFDHHWMMGSGWWGPGWIFMIVLWVLVIVALILLIRWLARQGGSRAPHVAAEDSALEILRQRYARGEIEKEEFEKKKRDLTQ